MSLDIWTTCTCCGGTVVDMNITHNLGMMWREAGCYEALYESEGLLASAVIPVIESAIALMKADPDRFRAHDAPNGWGTYDHALPWLESLLEDMKKCLSASIGVSR